jgi:hypothetical protein
MPPEHIKMVGIPPRKIVSFLWPVKDGPALKTSIASPANVCIEDNGNCVETRIEAYSALPLGEVDRG